MRKLIGLITILTIGLIGCSNTGNKSNGQNDKELQNQTTTIDDKAPKVTIKSTKGQAILIGKSIKLLDNNLKVVDDISKMTTKYVNITGISDTIFNDTKDFCDSYWYVRIKIGNKEGIVNGRQVFKIEGSDQDTAFLINGGKIEFLTTTCQAMGVVYQGDLMACPVDQPLIIRDEKNSFNGLIHVIPNDYYKEAIVNQDFQFFQLRSDNGFLDKIVAITLHDSGIKLSIHRRFQEGENDYEVLLRFDKGRYTAEYLNYGKIKYE